MEETFGAKVGRIRKEYGMTREELCGDESELSVRQLARIEGDQSTPSLSKVTYIAKCLELTVGELVDEDRLKLPNRYVTMKNQLLRIPTYSDSSRVKVRRELLETIYNEFYRQIPEEECVVIDCLMFKLDTHDEEDIDFEDDVLKDYFEQVVAKRTYKVNDLILLDLYLTYLSYEKDTSHYFYNDNNYYRVITKLLNWEPHDLAEKFQLNNMLLGNILLAFERGRGDIVQKVIEKSSQLMEEMNDFQKRPILNLVEWKYYLIMLNDNVKAEEHYQKAVLFADLIGDHYLKNKLTEEWEKDQV